MSEIFIIKDTGKGVINELLPEKVVAIKTSQSGQETDTLDTVTQRGAYSQVPISVGASYYKFGVITASNTRLVGAEVGTGYTGNNNLLIGIGLDDITSASYNTAIGTDALKHLIRTTNNFAIGTSALEYLDFETVGNSYGSTYGFNYAIGDNSLRFCTSGKGNISLGGMQQPNGKEDGTVFFTGKNNVAIGISTLNNATTASLNTVIGSGSAGYITTGNGNIVIGQGAALGLKTGVNNLFIGNGSGGQTTSTTDVSNKLCIEQRPYAISQTSFWDSRISPFFTNYKKGLISGDFLVRELNVDGKFSVTPQYIPTADATFTKNIVAKADGTFGWEDKITPSQVIQATSQAEATTLSVANPNNIYFWI